MIRRLGLSLAVCGMCVGWQASAADLPSMPQTKKIQTQVQRKKPKVKVAAPAVKKAAAKSEVIKKSRNLAVAADVPVVSEVPVIPERNEVDMAWVLDPLVATADGSKKEGSASVEGNLVVLEPGYVTSPYMIIELTGHVVKTAGSTARIDINVAGKTRKVEWHVDEVKSGAFTIELNETLSEGKLPAYFPVSAYAFASKTKQQAVVMVSLEKVTIRVGNVQVADKQ